jgi:hypothetical protein
MAESLGKKVLVQLEGDPFPVELRKSQVSACNKDSERVRSNRNVRQSSDRKEERNNMPATAEKVSAKQLRKEAQALGVKGWDAMSRSELAKAVAAASKNGNGKGKKSKVTKREVEEAEATNKTKVKAKSKKGVKKVPREKAAESAEKRAASKKAGKTTKAEKLAKEAATDKGAWRYTEAKNAPKELPAEGENPFRKGSNLHRVAALLLKGGNRRALAQKLADKVELHPYQKDSGDVDLNDYDKRILLGAQTMRDQFGYAIGRKGRGIDGSIIVFRPGGAKDPRKAVK